MSEHTGYPGAPPGWYPDPAGGPGQRWWDGYAWSEATVLPQRPAAAPPMATAAPPPLPPPPLPPSSPFGVAPPAAAPWATTARPPSDGSPADPVQAELRMVRLARVAVALPAACSIANLISDRLNADQWLDVGRQFRVDWRDAQNHVTPPAYQGPSAVSGANVLITVVLIAAVVVALVWQHRAASAGRALGLPARQSPAWGVGSWFVPIVNFWIPYQAVRDCLPTGDPHRARVLHWWLAWLATTVLGAVVGISALFSSGLALGLSVPVVLADLAIIAWAPGIVTAIAASHQAAMADPVGGSPAPL